MRVLSIVTLSLMLTISPETLRFTRTWLENAKPRIRDYDFSYDEIDRNAIRQAAMVFAEELMLLMMEQKYE